LITCLHDKKSKKEHQKFLSIKHGKSVLTLSADEKQKMIADGNNHKTSCQEQGRSLRIACRNDCRWKQP
jgi:hypothetical protein